MPSSAELRESAADAAARAEEVKAQADKDGRTMNEDEGKRFAALMDEAESLVKAATDQDRLERFKAKADEPEPRRVEPQMDTAHRSVIFAEPKKYPRGKLRAFTGPDGDADAFRSGQWMMAALFNNASARQWCNEHNVELRVQAQTSGLNAYGGYLVPTQFEQAVIDLRDCYGWIRQNAKVVQMTSDNMVVPRRSAGTTCYFVGDNDSITESNKQWNQVELTAKKCAQLVRMSSEINEDAIISMVDDLAQEMAYQFAKKEDECAVDGDGTDTYGRILGVRPKMIDTDHDGSYSDNSTAGDNWSEVTAAMLTSTMALLPQYAWAGAKWHCSPKAKAAMFDRLLAAGGGNTIMTLEAGAGLQYMGYPVVMSSAMPSDDSAAALNNKIMVIFGDVSQACTFGDRRGITLKVSADRYLEYDQIGIQATERFDINWHDIGDDTSAGPVVGMLGGT